VRIGLLGSIDGQASYVKGLGSFCLDALRAERVVYLGADDALDRVVSGWATQLVGEHPEESAIWLRTLRCVDATSEKIDLFIAAERARQALKRFESLPDADRRSLETLQYSKILLCHDREALAEEDLAHASIVAYGNCNTPQVEELDGRYFICPGSLTEAGLMVLDDDERELRLRVFDRTARLLNEQVLRRQRPPSELAGSRE
jgi:hypothetical protein